MSGAALRRKKKWRRSRHTECYIKPQNYERSKTKKYKSNMALRENMAYDAENDEYTCQAGQKLRAKYVGKRKSKSGFESEITYYECDDCSGCPHTCFSCAVICRFPFKKGLSQFSRFATAPSCPF